MHEQIVTVLEEVSGRLAAHAGGVSFVSFDEESGTLSVRFTGACGHCPLAAFTLEHAVQNEVKARVPVVQHVVLVK